MKKIILVSSISLVSLFLFGQAVDEELNMRLNEYIELSKKADFEGIMDYTHPKLFTLAPRAEIIKAFESIYENEDMSIRFDSMRVLKISPSFIHELTSYKKVDYFMSFSMHFKDSSTWDDAEFADMMIAMMKSGLAGMNIIYDKEKKAFIISGNTIMFAIKDNGKLWMFLGYDEDKKKFAEMIMPEKVFNHFGINLN